jgi:hypothetical protein
VLKPKLTSGLRDTREFSRRCRGLSKRGEILLVDGRWTFAWYRLRNCASAQQVGSRKFKGTASCFRSLSKTREFASANSLSSPPPLPNNFSPECESQVAVVYIVQKERARERERGGGKVPQTFLFVRFVVSNSRLHARPFNSSHFRSFDALQHLSPFREKRNDDNRDNDDDARPHNLCDLWSIIMSTDSRQISADDDIELRFLSSDRLRQFIYYRARRRLSNN